MGNIVVFKHEPAAANNQFADLQIGDPEFKSRRLLSTRELSAIWGVPESTLRYWRCAEVGPPYVKLGGRIKYDLVDVELYVRANKRNPSVRAHGG
jgi:Helix-turn-helix domain